ncbi:MAG: hypothetical protein FJX57_04080 [Alphaproteobacteria bacterium]|nr:hypothetical protein [Alphaproteobacteria bacterium]
MPLRHQRRRLSLKHQSLKHQSLKHQSIKHQSLKHLSDKHLPPRSPRRYRSPCRRCRVAPARRRCVLPPASTSIPKDSSVAARRSWNWRWARRTAASRSPRASIGSTTAPIAARASCCCQR